jgi:hypothetical protein
MSEIKVNKITPKQNCTQVTLGDSGDDIVVASGVNLKTAAVKDAAGNVIISRCGSNITIGSSGASIALACGASQTGFGRTGTVDWDTTAKTASFTAVSGNGYFINTTSGAVTMTLPASPSSGDIVAFKDYANTFDTNNLTIARNGSPITGVSANALISVEGQSGTLVYVDGTKGWMIVNASTDADLPAPAFVTATGGTVTCCGDYKIHTFTGPGTFCVSCAGNACGSNTVDYLVIAGGGGGGPGFTGGGGGAGGFRESKAPGAPWTASPLATSTSLPISIQGYSVTVGGGGATDNSGANSIFSSITSAGGGAGGTGGPGNFDPGISGGSGGGGAAWGTPAGPGGSGNTPPTSPPQGNNGGPGGGQTGTFSAGGGGGGAGGAGTAGPTNPSPGQAGPGGNGLATSISGSSVTRAGGGGGASDTRPDGSGGPGGGGSAPGGNGTTNTGSGGGGGGGAGGSGIVIIRYKFQ